jgi:hypothetical protein
MNVLSHMKVGETRQSGVVKVTRHENEYHASCDNCSWDIKYESPHTVDWLVFTHNRNFRKEGCKNEQGRTTNTNQ